MRLLHSYCNREGSTSHLTKVLKRAQSERVARTYSLKVAKAGVKRLSPETNASIAADYKAGMGVREIAQKYGINEGTAHRRLMRAGVPKRPSVISDEDIDLIRTLGSQGWTYDRIAERVGVSATTARNVLKRAGRFA